MVFNEMKLYAAKADILSGEDYGSIYGLLDDSRQEKVRKLKNEQERLRSIYAGLLLRHAFLEHGYEEKLWRQVKICNEAYGKPYIADIEGFYYSISHSGDWVICAADDTEIGADIQKIGNLKLSIAKRFYSKGEYDRLLSYEPDEDMQTTELYRLWAVKESCVKYTGRGIGAGISRYAANESYTRVTDIQTEADFLIKLYEQIPGYIVCICSCCGSFPENITIVDLAGSTFNMEEKEIC